MEQRVACDWIFVLTTVASVLANTAARAQAGFPPSGHEGPAKHAIVGRNKHESVTGSGSFSFDPSN